MPLADVDPATRAVLLPRPAAEPADRRGARGPERYDEDAAAHRRGRRRRPRPRRSATGRRPRPPPRSPPPTTSSATAPTWTGWRSTRGRRGIPSDNRVEAERAAHALELARSGRRVAVVSSGDPGVFAMAAAVLEVAERPEFAGVAGARAARADRRAGGGRPGWAPRWATTSARDQPVRRAQAVGRRRRPAAARRGRRPGARALQPAVEGTARTSSARRRRCCSRPARADTVVVVGRDVGGPEERLTVTTLGDARPGDRRHALPAARRLLADPGRPVRPGLDLADLSGLTPVRAGR